MKRFRQVTALLLAMVMVLGLAACGTGQTVSGQYRPNGQHQMQKPVEKPTTPDRPVPVPGGPDHPADGGCRCG